MRVREEVLLNKRLEVAAREAILHLLQQVLIAQVRLRCPAVEPALHDADAVNEALRRRAEVRFAQAELHEVDGRLEQLAVDAVLGELLQLRHGQMVESIEALRLRIVDDDAEERLQHVRLEDGVDVLAELCIDERLAQRRGRRAQESVLEDLEAHHRLVVERLARRPAQREEGLLGRALLLADRIEGRLALEVRELRLQVDLRRHGDAVEMREVFLVEVAQLLRDVHRAVKVDVAVRRVVVLRMEGDERLLREVRDGLGVAARLMAVRRRRVERVHDAALEQVVRRGERALHLVVDDAAVRERVLWLLDLIVPALLHEDLRVLAHVRVEDGIEVDVHEVLEVLVVAAGHRVHRLVRIRHRVEEGVERAFDELDERLLERVLARAAERRVLDDVRDARIVDRRRAERDGKDLVVVVVLEEEQARAALLVLERVGRRVDFRDVFLMLQAKAMDSVVYFHIF